MMLTSDNVINSLFKNLPWGWTPPKPRPKSTSKPKWIPPLPKDLPKPKSNSQHSLFSYDILDYHNRF